MFDNIRAYVERLMSLIRPRKLLFVAIDGVAPRAKLNQQRSRRYRTSAESHPQDWDSNVITPGTKFMQDLSDFLKRFIAEIVATTYKHLTVIFSDWSVPGEGEHKILEFMRQQRAQPGYDPNTKHCMYGADADLIMLGLITHEAHFYNVRESFSDISV